MFKRILNTAYTLTALLIILSCAKELNLGGGPLDEAPPKLIKSIPKDLETNYQENKVYLFFDEFVALKNFNKEFMMVPRPKNIKVKPPLEYASKKFMIQFDPIPGVNTYKIDFGKTIQDYREGNILEGLTLTFSLGITTDSGKIKGQFIGDTTQIKKDKLVALLYKLEQDEQFEEEIITLKQAPYTARVDQDSFVFDYLSKGQYKVIVLEDLNNSKLYDPGTEHIGFLTPHVLPDSGVVHQITLFKANNVPVFKSSEQSKGKILLVYDYIDAKGKFNIEPLNVPKPYKVLKMADKKKNKTYFEVWHKTYIEEQTTFKFKDTSNDTISVNLKQDSISTLPQAELYLSTTKTIHPSQELYIQSKTVPIKSFDKSRILLTDKQSNEKLQVNGKVLNGKMVVDFNRKDNTSYQMQLNSGAVTDFFGNANHDTLKFVFSTMNLSKQTGHFELQLKEPLAKPLMVQLKSDVFNIKKELKKGETQLLFEHLPNQTYKLVLFVDDNHNQLWDNGDFFNQKQPEIKYGADLTVKAGETTTIQVSGSSVTNLSLKIKN